LGDVGKNKTEAITKTIESDYLFPLLRGRDVHSWRASPSGIILIPHRADNFSEPVNVADLRKKAPLTLEFLSHFEKELRKRSGYKQLHKSRDEFYVVGNVGNYTLAPYKVVFKELTDIFQCAVVEPTSVDGVRDRPIIPDHKLLFITCDTRGEAYFLAGLLNSVPARAALYSASVGVQTQSYYPTDVARIRLPEFDESKELHRDIVRISKECHRQATLDPKDVAQKGLELELAQCASGLWNISTKEAVSLLAYYSEIRILRKRSS
jgi:hypothetical protein